MSLAIAAALHALVLLCIDFPSPPIPTASSVIELRLTGYGAANVPETQPPAAESAADVPAVQEAVAPSPPVAVNIPIERPASLDLSSPGETQPPPNRLKGVSAIDLAQAVAANAALSRVSDAAGPRVHRLDDETPPRRPDFAYYLESWQRKVTRIGQLNYPREAQANGITGSLRLLVIIAPDGDLTDVRLLESSGHSVLDDAAVRIVYLAAPFAPFSPAMREHTDRLEIERTWLFRNSRLSS